jgi:hypothetical protein
MRNRYDDERNRFEGDRYSNRSDRESRGGYGARPARYSQHQAEYGTEPDDGRGNWDRGGDASYRSSERDEYGSRNYGGYNRETRGEGYGDTMSGRYEQRRSPWSWQQGEHGGYRGDASASYGYGQGNQYEPRPFGDQNNWSTRYRTSGYRDGEHGHTGQTWGEPIGSLGYAGPPRGDHESLYGRSGQEVEGWRSSDRQGGQHRGKGPKGYTRSDERIREEVSDRLMFDADIDASEIEIEVRNGEVTLRGTVDRRETKRAVEDIAECVQGVREVQNQLRISGNGRADTGRESGLGAQSAGRAGTASATGTGGGRGRSEHDTDSRSTTGTAR